MARHGHLRFSQPLLSSSSMLSVRPLEPADIDHLLVDVDASTYMRRVVERDNWSHKGMRAFVAENPHQDHGNQVPVLVGYAYVGLGYPPYFPALAGDVKQLYVAHLEVFESFRRRGFATQMLRYFTSEAQSRALGVHVVRAECEKGWRVDFYRRVGLLPVPYKGPRDDYPTPTHTMLELWLTDPSSC